MDNLSSRLRDLETPAADVSVDQVRSRVGRQRRREALSAVVIALALVVGSVGIGTGLRRSAGNDIAQPPGPTQVTGTGCSGVSTSPWAPGSSGTNVTLPAPITAAWWCSASDDWMAPSQPLTTSLVSLRQSLESLPPLDDPHEVMQCASSSPDFRLVLESASGERIVQASLGNCGAVTVAGQTRSGAARLRTELSDLWRQQQLASNPTAQTLVCVPASSLLEVELDDVTQAIGCGTRRGPLDPTLVEDLVRAARATAEPVGQRPSTAMLRLVLADAHGAQLPVFVDDQKVVYIGEGLRWQPDVSDGEAGELARRLEPFLR